MESTIFLLAVIAVLCQLHGANSFVFPDQIQRAKVKGFRFPNNEFIITDFRQPGHARGNTIAQGKTDRYVNGNGMIWRDNQNWGNMGGQSQNLRRDRSINLNSFGSTSFVFPDSVERFRAQPWLLRIAQNSQGLDKDRIIFPE